LEDFELKHPNQEIDEKIENLGEENKKKLDNQNEITSEDNNNNLPKENEVTSSKEIDKKDSLFQRILEKGFDGVTTNPNYKLLALLIILLINLSVFFMIGNLGKSFLMNAGLLD